MAFLSCSSCFGRFQFNSRAFVLFVLSRACPQGCPRTHNGDAINSHTVPLISCNELRHTAECEERQGRGGSSQGYGDALFSISLPRTQINTKTKRETKRTFSNSVTWSTWIGFTRRPGTEGTAKNLIHSSKVQFEAPSNFRDIQIHFPSSITRFIKVT